MPSRPASLRQILDAARAAWPGVEVAPDVFERHLAAHLAANETLDQLNTTDLYLACAVAAGDAAGVAAFEMQVLTKIAAHLGKTGSSRADIDEVMQQLRERLLVPGDGRPPRITTFAGRGSLVGWVRMAAARIAIDLRTSQRPGVPIDDDFELVAADPDPQLELLRQRYGQELREAFKTALAALPAREAAILRLHFLDGMSARSIGEVYRVHARTVQKWLALAREHILATTRDLLRSRLQLSARELDSLLALVQSQLAESISRLLKR